MPRYLIFGVVSLTLLVHNISSNAIAVAFPEINNTFGSSLVLSGWVLTVFQLAMIVSLPAAGKASDALGRKRTFVAVVAIFTLGSLLSAVAPNIYLLIVFRAIQGLGAGGFITSATGIIVDTFPEHRQRSVGLITSVLTVGGVLGPTIGGWLTEYLGWRSIFWLAAPWGVLAIVGAAFLLKPDTGVKKLAFDLRGAGYFGMSLVALMTGFTTLGGKGSEISWSVAPISIAIGFALLIMFVRHERRTQAPLIDPQLFHGRPFMAANAFNLLFGFTTGALVLLPLYAISVYGASTVQSGIAVTPRSAAMMAASIVTSFMIMRWGYRKPMLCGVALMVLAATFLALEFQSVSIPGVTISGMAIMLVVVGLSGLGHGIISPAANNACIELMPDRVSTITGLRQTIRNVGHALGIASATIVLENSASLSRGFSFVFGGIAIVAVSTLPFILAMPRSPSDFKSRGTELRK